MQAHLHLVGTIHAALSIQDLQAVSPVCFAFVLQHVVLSSSVIIPILNQFLNKNELVNAVHLIKVAISSYDVVDGALPR